MLNHIQEEPTNAAQAPIDEAIIFIFFGDDSTAYENTQLPLSLE